MNSLILQSGDRLTDTSAVVRGGRARHIIDVLKKGVGDTVLAGALDGPLGTVRILSVAPDEVVMEWPQGDVPPVPSVDLILAMPRPKVMKRLWLPIASLGVRSITIIGAEKVEPFYFASHATDPDVYIPRLIEGLEQARDTRMPAVQVIDSFARFDRDVLPGFATVPRKLLAEPGAPHTIRDTLAQPSSSPVVLAVGPEGGWSPHECDTFRAHGFQEVGLGPRALRTDTAVISLLALVHDNRRIGVRHR